MRKREFKPSETRLPYDKWKKLIESIRHELCDDQLKWISAWESWDLAVGHHFTDEARALIRYGHYLGWHEKLKNSPQ